MLAVLSVCSQEELEGDIFSEDEQALMDQATTPEERHARREQIKNKIRAVGRLQVMFQNLRYGCCINADVSITHVVHIQRGIRECLRVQRTRPRYGWHVQQRSTRRNGRVGCARQPNTALYPQLRRRVSGCPPFFIIIYFYLIPLVPTRVSHRRRFDIANERLPEFSLPPSYPSVPVPSMMRRPWGSGANTPTGEGEVTPISAGPVVDVPGGWPAPVVPAEELSMRPSGVEESNEDVEPPVGRSARGRRAGRKGKGKGS